jgi:hypothetical protein
MYKAGIMYPNQTETRLEAGQEKPADIAAAFGHRHCRVQYAGVSGSAADDRHQRSKPQHCIKKMAKRSKNLDDAEDPSHN